MAFENGNNMYDYCENIYKKYVLDDRIFIKALQIIQYYQTRVDFPYCSEQMNDSINKTIGSSLEYLADVTYKYGVLLKNEMVWDVNNIINYVIDNDLKETVAVKFQDELLAFMITISPLLDDICMGKNASVEITKALKKSTYGEKSDIRLIRDDGCYFDFCISNEGIDRLCETLQRMKHI